MVVSIIEGIAAALMYLFGGALVLFIYEAYVKTKQKSIMYMAIGFFIVIFGSNLSTLSEALQSWTNSSGPLDASAGRTLSLVIQLVGIVLLLISAMRPPDDKA